MQKPLIKGTVTWCADDIINRSKIQDINLMNMPNV